MADNVSTRQPGLSSPARNIALVTPDDANDLPNVAKAIEVQTAGNIQLTTVGGVTITKYFGVGYHPLSVKRIWSASTTASGIYALYD
ncbi:MAG: hypothetical protein IT435_05550 [Phycisphaerales bacterium]|nr:hypothetical protein [Phycisphaerales bacterium]